MLQQYFLLLLLAVIQFRLNSPQVYDLPAGLDKNSMIFGPWVMNSDTDSFFSFKADLSTPNKINYSSTNSHNFYANMEIYFTALGCQNPTPYYHPTTNNCYDVCPSPGADQGNMSCIPQPCPYDCLTCDNNGNCLTCDSVTNHR